MPPTQNQVRKGPKTIEVGFRIACLVLMLLAAALPGCVLGPASPESDEALLRKILDLAERYLGQEHPRTLILLNNLALSLENQGRYDEAEPLYVRAL